MSQIQKLLEETEKLLSDPRRKDAQIKSLYFEYEHNFGINDGLTQALLAMIRKYRPEIYDEIVSFVILRLLQEDAADQIRLIIARSYEIYSDPWHNELSRLQEAAIEQLQRIIVSTYYAEK